MIREFSPFPYVLPSGEIKPGILASQNPVCVQCQTRECRQKGYSSLALGVVEHCFKGLNYVFAADFSNEHLVWNGFLLKGRKYPSNYKLLLRNGYEIDQATVNRVIALFDAGGDVQQSVIRSQKRGESRALHDLKHLVTALSRVVETDDVRRATDKSAPALQPHYDVLRETVTYVYNILGAIKNQIELSDYILAPDITDVVKEREIDIFPLIDKNVRMYNVLAIQQKKAIELRSLSGFVLGRRRLKEHFVLLPAILLQNAIKYSLEGMTTTVEVADLQGKLEIAVRSIGSIIPQTERDRIWHLGEQYIHKNDTSKGGSGFGLYLAKSICESTGFKIRYEAEFHEMVRGFPVGENRFVVTEN